MARAGNSNRSDWIMELSIGAGILLLALGAWAYKTFSSPASDARPQPVWLTIPPVVAQMTDGRMLNVKVNLQVARSSDRDELSAHANAFRMVVEEVAAAMTQDQVTGPQGMQHLGDAIETGIDDYLDKRHIDTRIDGVVFDELMLMP